MATTAELVAERMAYQDRIERAVDLLTDLGADLEGSVPDPRNYQLEANLFIDRANDEITYDEIVSLAEEWCESSDRYEALVGATFLSFIK